jgi:hypothetical protein
LELCLELDFQHFGRIKQQCLRFAHAMKNREFCRKLEKTKALTEIEQISAVATEI